jgi:zinc transport system substrate-binding protein
MFVKKLVVFCWLLIFSVTLVGCAVDQAKSSDNSKDKVVVYASFYPLAFFAQEIGGELVEVHTITPVGAEPHNYEPSQRDVVKLSSADMLIYNGVGLEGWVEKLTKNLHPQQTLIVEASKHLRLHATNDEGNEDEEEHHDHGVYDPHVWLDPVLAKQQAETIKQALIQKDKQHQKIYEQNYAELAKKFDELHTMYQRGLSQVKQKEVVTSHAAFHYLTERYGLHQVAISGLSPDAQPSPKQLTKIISFARQKQIRYIFFEKRVNDRVAQIVTKELQAQPLILDPLESLSLDEVKQGENYFTIAKRNLENLKIALQ